MKRISEFIDVLRLYRRGGNTWCYACTAAWRVAVLRWPF